MQNIGAVSRRFSSATASLSYFRDAATIPGPTRTSEGISAIEVSPHC
jgi:hypothetical protein